MSASFYLKITPGDNVDKTKKALMEYVNAASDFADQVKRNIKKDGTIDNKTVLALNRFTIAANAIADLTSELNETDINRH